jgi:hypothetical protein
VRIHLCIALALHAALLGAGARSPRAEPAPRAAAAVEGIVIEAAPEPEEAPPRPDPPGASVGTASPPAHPGARARTAPAPRHIDLLQAIRSEARAPAAPGGDPSGGSAGDRSTSTGEGGAGDFGVCRETAIRPQRRELGERWDAISGPRGEEAPAQAAEADESTLPRRTIEGVVAGSAPRLRRCYADGLRREPGLAGRIPVRFVVEPGGSVLVASDAGSTVADPAVVRCILSAFAAMTFPRPQRGEPVRAAYVVSLPLD